MGAIRSIPESEVLVFFRANELSGKTQKKLITHNDSSSTVRFNFNLTGTPKNPPNLQGRVRRDYSA
jgi:hypothetical protein